MGNLNQATFTSAARAYRAALRETRPDHYRILEHLEPGATLVVPGNYDHIETVLRAAELPFGFLPGRPSLWPERLASAQTLWVNCPGRLRPDATPAIAEWVRRGGTLGTTDWAVKLLEAAFPGKVRHNGGRIPDSVVDVECCAPAHPFVRGLLHDDRTPRWWMESASYPCEVLDPEAVRVLVRSDEVCRRHGSGAVVVEWSEGEGRVLHLVSHRYLQRADARDRRDDESAGEFIADLGLKGKTADDLAAAAGKASAVDLKAAYSVASLLLETVVDQQEKRGEKGR